MMHWHRYLRNTVPRIILVVFALLVVTATATSAMSNSEYKHYLARTICGEASEWTVKRDSFRTINGGVLRSSDDENCKAPKQGRLDTSCGQIWSNKNHVRWIRLSKATYWNAGSRSKMTDCVRNPQMAAKMYRTGNGTAQYWHFLAGGESLGWEYDGPVTQIWVFHGHADHQDGTTFAGNWTPAVPKAGAWFYNS